MRLILLAALCLCATASAQFRDDFDHPPLKGWTFETGDGSATMDFRPGDGHASILVDSTKDQRNIWWAFIAREVSGSLDLRKLKEPGYELRIEARIRSSHAPRRVNLHLNTQKTTDFHSHLMEFDIPDTTNWHTISYTTHDFDAEPGDRVNGQLALMDWGLGKYQVDIDYFRVDVVNVAEAVPDKGVQTPYRPPIPNVNTFKHQVAVAHDSMIDLNHPGVNFNQWYAAENGGRTNVLTVDGTLFVLLRWDLAAFAGKHAAGAGLLELTTHSVQRTDSDLEEFGMVRVSEILGGDPRWDQKTVTLESLSRGRALIGNVINSQMIIDVSVAEQRGGRTYATISRPVLQRLIDGKTQGIAIRPLGAINAAFYSMERGDSAARLCFNLQEDGNPR